MKNGPLRHARTSARCRSMFLTPFLDGVPERIAHGITDVLAMELP